MAETITLIIGIIILSVVIFDFFFTTLSGSGSAFLTRTVSFLAHKVVRKLQGLLGRSIYSYSGLLVNLSVLASWILLVWFGLFLVFSFNPDAMTNSSGRVANWVERLYYTGYVLSTLGIGNFKTTTVFFEILTSLFSFFGFIFFTSSMTYLISVSSALINKRTLCRSIQNIGKDPRQIAEKLQSLDSSYSMQQMLNFQEMIDRHAVNHQAYPVVHFFSHKREDVSLALNLTRLDEAVNILLSDPEAKSIKQELTPLHSSLSHFINHLNKNYSNTLPKKETSRASYVLPYEISNLNKEELRERRRILGGILRNEGFDWENVVQKTN